MTKWKRKYPCALCKEDVIFDHLTKGWTVTCGCGSFIREKGPDVDSLLKV